MNQSTDELTRAPSVLKRIAHRSFTRCKVIVVSSHAAAADRRRDRQSNGKYRSSARLAFHVDIAIEQLGQPAAYGETQAGSPV